MANCYFDYLMNEAGLVVRETPVYLPETGNQYLFGGEARRQDRMRGFKYLIPDNTNGGYDEKNLPSIVLNDADSLIRQFHIFPDEDWMRATEIRRITFNQPCNEPVFRFLLQNFGWDGFAH